MNSKWNSLREWLNKESIQFNNKHPLTDVIYQMDRIDRDYYREHGPTCSESERICATCQFHIKEGICGITRKPIWGRCGLWQSVDTSFTNKARPEHGDEIFALEGRVNKLENKIKLQNMAKEMLERIRLLEENK